MNAKYVKLCPKCSSLDVLIEKTNPLQPAMGLPAFYTCAKCGHSGRNFPEVRVTKLKTDGKIKTGAVKKLTKNELVDTSYGNFVVNFIWKFTGPATIFFGLFWLFAEHNYVVGSVSIFAGLFMTYITYTKRRKNN